MNNTDPLLLLLTPAFPSDERDENWVHSQQLFIKALNNIRPELRVIILSFIYPHRKSTYTWNGIQVISFDGNTMKKFRRPFLWRRILHSIREIHEQHKISGIISFWCGECALVGNIFSRTSRVRHLIWICGQDARKTNKMIRLIRPKPGQLVAKSDFLADEFYRNHRIRPAHIVTNGIDESLFNSPPAARNIDIMGAGSFNSLKQYHLFIDIVNNIQKKISPLRVLLCGDGQERTRLQNQIQELDLQDCIRLSGMLTPSEVIWQMQHARVFLHPSSFEGFSMACLEAVYAGAHVVSFTKPMHHDIKHWHTVNTLEEMTQVTFGLLNDKETIYEPVYEYSMEQSAGKMISLLGICC